MSKCIKYMPCDMNNDRLISIHFTYFFKLIFNVTHYKKNSFKKACCFIKCTINALGNWFISFRYKKFDAETVWWNEISTDYFKSIEKDVCYRVPWLLNVTVKLFLQGYTKNISIWHYTGNMFRFLWNVFLTCHSFSS